MNSFLLTSVSHVFSCVKTFNCLFNIEGHREISLRESWLNWAFACTIVYHLSTINKSCSNADVDLF